MRSLKFAVAAIAILAAGLSVQAEPSFTLVKSTITRGENPQAKYSESLAAPAGNQYWITVCKAGAADSAWGSWQYCKNGDTNAFLAPQVQAGDYEIRLHAPYPKKSHGVIFRVAVEVK